MNFEEKIIERLKRIEREVERLRVKERPAGGSGVTDHGALTGLSDNDHPQYLLTTGEAADSAKLGGVNAADYEKGWIPASGWKIYQTNWVNNVTGAQTLYSVGDKIKLTNDGSTKYFYIISAPTSASLKLVGDTTVGAAGTVLTNVYYSHASNPVGFPQWFDYTPILTVSGGTAPTYATFINRYCQVGKLVVVTGQWYNASGGTAGAGAAEILVTLPVPPKNLDAVITGSAGYGNGGAYATGGIYIFASSSKFAITKLDAGFLTGAAQNNAMRSVYFTFEYEAA
jgi:hypothetical protein